MSQRKIALLGGDKNEAAVAEQERQARTVVEQYRVKAKPGVNIVLAPPYGVAFVEGKGSLDIESTVVAVPLPLLIEVMAAFMTSNLAPMFAQMPRIPLSQSALDDGGTS